MMWTRFTTKQSGKGYLILDNRDSRIIAVSMSKTDAIAIAETLTARSNSMVRAKFHCDGITPAQDRAGATIHLSAVTYGSEENDRFFSLTPAGTLSLSVVNPETAARFEAGKFYYIDFTEAAK